MNTCAACKKPVKLAEMVKCSVKSCVRFFHYECVNLTADNCKLQTNFKCPLCTSRIPKGDNSNTPVRVSASDRVEPLDTNVTVRKLQSQSESDRNVTSGDALRSDIIDAIRGELTAVVREVIRAELKPFSDDIKSLQASLSSMHDENAELRNQLKDCRSDSSTLREQLNVLESRVTNMEREYRKQEQWSRLQNLEIIGVPEKSDESLLEVVTTLTKHVGLELQAGDVEFAHRVQPRKAGTGRPRSIVLRLKNRITKDSILSAARKCRNLNTLDLAFGWERRSIYVNEHLTPQNKALLNACKTRARDSGYKFTWTRNCRIYTRKDEKSPPILISTELDLVKIK